MAKVKLSDLRDQVRGQVIEPGDDAYEEARQVHNGMSDRRPKVVVRSEQVADVIAAVNFARESSLDLSVRGGGHSAPGFGTNDGGVVIDLSPMRTVRVDPKAKTGRAGGGTTWGDFNQATHAFGLATTGGIISTTGIAGLTLGGGIGYLSRGFGLSLDNLISADVVTADGSFAVASEKENADLFWALRGGGGNFGVVTSLEYKLHPVKEVYAGPIFYELDAAGELFRFYREFIKDAPEQLGAFPAFQTAPPLPFIPENRHGDKFCAAVVHWAGPIDEGENAIKPFLDIAPVVAQSVGPLPYPALNAAFDPLFPKGIRSYWKGNFVTELTDAAVEAHLTHGPKVPTLSSTMHLYPINGACHRVGASDTAFAYRDATFATVIVSAWDDPTKDTECIQWVRDYSAATAQHSEVGGYINFMDGDDQGRIKDNYRQNFDRLVEVKRRYDPDNLFHLNQNIKPN
jgi:FAD/FMN-containing dehydrogenase